MPTIPPTEDPLDAFVAGFAALNISGASKIAKIRRPTDWNFQCVVLTPFGSVSFANLEKVTDPYQVQVSIYAKEKDARAVANAIINAFRPYVGDSTAGKVWALNGWSARRFQISGPDCMGQDTPTGLDKLVIRLHFRMKKLF